MLVIILLHILMEAMVVMAVIQYLTVYQQAVVEVEVVVIIAFQLLQQVMTELQVTDLAVERVTLTVHTVVVLVQVIMVGLA